MPDDTSLSFGHLVRQRQELQRFCSDHYTILNTFRDGISFRVYADEQKLTGVRHLSSSATCIESLLTCASSLLPTEKKGDPVSLAKEFARNAVELPDTSWTSGGAAHIYCRCRSLPVIIEHLPAYSESITKHLDQITSQLLKDPLRLAIGEAHPDECPKDWYPPNGFHTYWFLVLLEKIEATWPTEFHDLNREWTTKRAPFERTREEMLLWARNIVGFQSSLHSAASPAADSDQLAWGLAILMQFDKSLHASLGAQDFVQYGLRSLFAAQTPIGIWRSGAPLFHYPTSGNAHCYVFETFSELLKAALIDRAQGNFLRRALRPYCGSLLHLWKYAVATAVPLERAERQFAWTSGHRVNHKEPEGWATASVFAYSQSLRRLVGIWTREEAARDLEVKKPSALPGDAFANLVERGDTWVKAPGCDAASKLFSLYVNPTTMVATHQFDYEPDYQVIPDRHARGAILFGPPGTSKTTLARNVANAIGWDYVELHASHFVAEGLPSVQKTANNIFDRLRELDRTVILFDEIDELVRTRDGHDGDAFGRFLTTSMLPKLAELWQGRRVIYFVATNHIKYFDPAIVRAQRFDAKILVGPPSYERKRKQLYKLFAEKGVHVDSLSVTKEEIDKAILEIAGAEGTAHTQNEKVHIEGVGLLAKYLLLRWDQLNELVENSKTGEAETISITPELLKNALKLVHDPTLDRRDTYIEYVESEAHEVQDFNRIEVLRIEGDFPPELAKYVTTNNSVQYIQRKWVSSNSCVYVAPATIRFGPPGHYSSPKL